MKKKKKKKPKPKPKPRPKNRLKNQPVKNTRAIKGAGFFIGMVPGAKYR